MKMQKNKLELFAIFVVMLLLFSSIAFATPITISSNTTNGYFPTQLTVGTTGPDNSTTGKAFEVVGDVVARASSSAGNPAASMTADSYGLNLWANGAYNDVTPGTGWTRVLTITSAGLIGAGTPTPARKMELVGTTFPQLGITNTNNAEASIMFTSVGRTWTMGADGGGINDGFFINDQGAPATRFVIDTSGNVGIGTTAPVGKLHLYQQSGGTNELTLDTNFSSGNAYALDPFITGVSNGGFSIRDATNSVDRFDIQYSTGNVGIGNNNPTYKLSVTGNAAISNGLSVTGTSNATTFNGAGTGLTGTAASLSIGGNAATATALAANGANCVAGSFPLGVDASGAVESCTALSTIANVTATLTSGYVTKATGASSIGNSLIYDTGSAIGIGTTTPIGGVQISGTAQFPIIYANVTDSTASSVAGLQARADTNFIDVLAHASPRVVTRYGIALGNWTEISSFTGASGTNSGLIIGVQPASPIVFGTNNLERMRIDGSGNLGIGTTNPNSKFEVSGGDINISTGGKGLIFPDGTKQTTAAGAGGNVTGTMTSGYVQKATSGSALGNSVIFESSGIVGIRTTIPKSSLHVADSAQSASIPALGAYTNTQFIISNSDLNYGLLSGVLSNGNAWMQAQRTDATATAYNLFLQPNGGNVGIGVTSTSAKLSVASAWPQISAGLDAATNIGYFGYAGTNVEIASPSNAKNISLDAPNIFLNANVGIGTTNPNYKLDVSGTTHITGNLYFGNTVTNPASGFSNQVGAGFDASTGQFQSAANNVEAAQFGRFGGAGSIITLRYAGTSIGTIATDGTNMQYTATGNLQLQPTGGNVGIGTTAPSERLSVVGNLSSTTGAFFATSSGSVGIGTTNPGHKLDVTNSGTNNVYIGADVSGYPVIGTTYGSGSNIELYNGATGAMTFTTSSVSYPFIFTNGNVGIGNTAPSEKLGVTGNLSSTTGAFFATSSGSVGIGTTNPSYKLDVSGTIRGTTSVSSASFIYTSDARLKTNVSAITGTSALAEILSLKPITFNWIDKNVDTRTHYGFIAQDVEKVLPNAVVTGADGYKAVEYGNLVAPLTAAVQQQQKQIDAQEKEISDLRAELEALKAGRK